jgi:hypothetical protein
MRKKEVLTSSDVKKTKNRTRKNKYEGMQNCFRVLSPGD